ncbi:unnamed protein product, partial [Prorocentrum cordatum]
VPPRRDDPQHPGGGRLRGVPVLARGLRPGGGRRAVAGEHLRRQRQPRRRRPLLALLRLARLLARQGGPPLPLCRSPELRREYQTRMDSHALGVTALRCLMELWRPSQECEPDGVLGERLRLLRSAWKRYWSDSERFWQPVYRVFQKGGDFGKLRSAYVAAGVHHALRDDLQALHRALRGVACHCGGPSAATPASSPRAPGCGPAELFDALLRLISPGTGGREDTPAGERPARSGLDAAAPRRGAEGQGQGRSPPPDGHAAQGAAPCAPRAQQPPKTPEACPLPLPARGLAWPPSAPSSPSTRSPHSPLGALSTPNYATPISAAAGDLRPSASRVRRPPRAPGRRRRQSAWCQPPLQLVGFIAPPARTSPPRCASRASCSRLLCGSELRRWRRWTGGRGGIQAF